MLYWLPGAGNAGPGIDNAGLVVIPENIDIFVRVGGDAGLEAAIFVGAEADRGKPGLGLGVVFAQHHTPFIPGHVDIAFGADVDVGTVGRRIGVILEVEGGRPGASIVGDDEDVRAASGFVLLLPDDVKAAVWSKGALGPFRGVRR